MGIGTLTIFNASAGSGKTFSLTGIYLLKLFASRYNYRKILAVTFTNKATAEMKSRILDQLCALSSGLPSDYLEMIIDETGRDEKWVRKEAGAVLDAILHDFSRFSVSTIDSFFQKILRAFTRETGLNPGFSIELDHSLILDSAVRETIASASENKMLRHWLTDFAKSNIEDEKGWNLKYEIIRLGQELFREKFKTLSTEERATLSDKDMLASYIGTLKKITSVFENTLAGYGKTCQDLFSAYELSDEMFYLKGRGVPSFVRKLISGDTGGPSDSVRKTMDDPPRWCTGKMDPRLERALGAGLADAVRASIEYYDANVISYKSAAAILSNIYSLGILSDVLQKVREITSAENFFLLSDAGEIIYRIIAADQIPFIYEKAGTRYEHFMIDEFQDTSVIQWSNFKPLIINSMAEGNDNLVVGDIKQSIYRWRNSDWTILAGMLGEVDDERILSVPLDTNWRSRENIIKFNNALFTLLPGILDTALPEGNNSGFASLYSGAVQKDPGKGEGGYVKMEFIEGEDNNEKTAKILENLPAVLEKLQDIGYSPSDTGILVRYNNEGASVLKRMTDYANTCSPEKKALYNYNIVSNDSLILSNSPAIGFITSVLKCINNPDDLISRAAMLRGYLLSTGKADVEKHILHPGLIGEEMNAFFPEGYDDFFDHLTRLPLFEITENIIGFFNLGTFPENVAYLNCFQDLVLDFTGKKNSELSSFLEWWENEGKRKSVVLPENQNATRVLTIHKSKGLEFRAVIVPFISWNLDHQTGKAPTLWVKPDREPFNAPGIVPVRYRKDLVNTIFAEDYTKEKFSAHVDSLNLLYVAFTRARDVLWGFAPAGAGEGSIASLLEKALSSVSGEAGGSVLLQGGIYREPDSFFEFGRLIKREPKDEPVHVPIRPSYNVSKGLGSLRLKLHGENYFLQGEEEKLRKINYGKLMHEIFESVRVPADVEGAVEKLVLEGKLPAASEAEMISTISTLIAGPVASDWFREDNEVMTEASILLPSGSIRRPDRIITRDGRIIVIDFKFGKENPAHSAQVRQYTDLLGEMGYAVTEGFLWYVDKNMILTV
ncbi:MAG: UvrD-helicase domain-containing protein [Bacteroidales bacterium]|jgi:ATP-dependent exoDNAse (exonuclease V) beta subunit|nr:UvrD-helicase domain-containing protein [Bacteroidales bacterium]